MFNKIACMCMLAISGCSGLKEIAIDAEFTDEEHDAIIDAIHEWVKASDSSEAMVFTADGFVDHGEFTEEDWNTDADFGLMFKVSTEESGWKYLSKELNAPSLRGAANYDTGNIMIAVNLADSKNLFYRVVLHELGHFHGLDHYFGGIMQNGSGNNFTCLTSVDVSHFCKINPCGPNAGSTCE